jgi:hypothetical protein
MPNAFLTHADTLWHPYKVLKIPDQYALRPQERLYKIVTSIGSNPTAIGERISSREGVECIKIQDYLLDVESATSSDEFPKEAGTRSDCIRQTTPGLGDSGDRLLTNFVGHSPAQGP